MNFETLCNFRNEVLQVNNLAAHVDSERKRSIIKSPSFSGTKKANKGDSNPTEDRALKLAELSQELEAKQQAVATGVRAAADYIETTCKEETAVAEMLKLYFINGFEFWQLKAWKEKTEFVYDPIDCLYWFFKITTTPEQREFFHANGRLPKEGEL